jgi:hypothetical protein
MSKPMIAVLILSAVGAVAMVDSATAADLNVPTQAAPARAAECGPCGCLRVTYDRHREVLTTYGTDFDPRNYDTTQPHYFLGAVRAYPQYSCDGNAPLGQ